MNLLAMSVCDRESNILLVQLLLLNSLFLSATAACFATLRVLGVKPKSFCFEVSAHVFCSAQECTSAVVQALCKFRAKYPKHRTSEIEYETF